MRLVQKKFLGVLALVAATSLVVAVHCGSNESTCDKDATGQCRGACKSETDCPPGQHCGPDDKCMAQCSASAPCPAGLTCSPRGRCEPSLSSEDGGGGDSCIDVTLQLSRPIPTVVLLIDQSGSMAVDFADAGSRWDVLKNALLSPTGILQTLASEVRFGLTMYGNATGNATCPDLTGVPAAIDNFATINGVYAPAGTIPNTPTGESMLRVVGLDDAGAPVPNGLAAADAGGPKIVILATDGDPDSCADPTANDDPTTPARREAAKQISTYAVQKAFAAGVRTYVIAVGDEVSELHQQEVANLGLGFAADAGDAAPFYRPSDGSQLATVIRNIVVDARSCTFALNGVVQPGEESKGKVTLDGGALGFNDPNGWKLVDRDKIELVGTACATVKQSATANLTVKFPCGAVRDIR